MWPGLNGTVVTTVPHFEHSECYFFFKQFTHVYNVTYFNNINILIQYGCLLWTSDRYLGED